VSFVTLDDDAANPLPNLLIIYADDMGFSEIAAYGKLPGFSVGVTNSVPTPKMDTFASEGMVLTQAHSCSGVCTPSRYGILTGRHSWCLRGDGVLASGIVGNYGNSVTQQGEVTIAQYLKDTGYDTAAFGKWHLGASIFVEMGVNLSALAATLLAVRLISIYIGSRIMLCIVDLIASSARLIRLTAHRIFTCAMIKHFSMALSLR
jgi:hypothetical protein